MTSEFDAVVRHDERRHRRRALDRARHVIVSSSTGSHRHSRIALSAVSLTLRIAHQAHGPAGVVVGAQRWVGKVLLLQQDLGEPSVGLVAFDDSEPAG